MAIFKVHHAQGMDGEPGLDPPCCIAHGEAGLVMIQGLGLVEEPWYRAWWGILEGDGAKIECFKEGPELIKVLADQDSGNLAWIESHVDGQKGEGVAEGMDEGGENKVGSGKVTAIRWQFGDLDLKTQAAAEGQPDRQGMEGRTMSSVCVESSLFLEYPAERPCLAHASMIGPFDRLENRFDHPRYILMGESGPQGEAQGSLEGPGSLGKAVLSESIGSLVVGHVVEGNVMD